MVVCPSSLAEHVLTLALAVSFSEKLPCGGLAELRGDLDVVGFGAGEHRLEVVGGLAAPGRAALRVWASLDSIRAEASSAACMAVRAEAARL